MYNDSLYRDKVRKKHTDNTFECKLVYIYNVTKPKFLPRPYKGNIYHGVLEKYHPEKIYVDKSCVGGGEMTNIFILSRGCMT